MHAARLSFPSRSESSPRAACPGSFRAGALAPLMMKETSNEHSIPGGPPRGAAASSWPSLVPRLRSRLTRKTTDEIVVTGVPRDRAPGEIAQSVTVVTGETLDRVRAGNLGETLANQLGVSSSYFGAGASRPIIRGLAGARVQMLEDGIDSMDAATVSDDHAVTVEPLAADQIEIFRGPTTLLYGSGAVGGVVNTVTTRIPDAGSGRRVRGRIRAARRQRGDGARRRAYDSTAAASSFAWHFDAGTARQRRLRDSGLRARRRRPREPDPEDVFGVVENSASESEAAAFGASWLRRRRFHRRRLQHVRHAVRDSGPRAPSRRRRAGAASRGGAGRGGAYRSHATPFRRARRLAGPSRRHRARRTCGSVSTTTSTSSSRAAPSARVFTNEATELRLELLHRSLGNWSGAFGVQFGDREFAAVGEEAFVPPVDTSTLGVFLVEQLDLESWELSFGGRRRAARAHAVERLADFRRSCDEPVARCRARVRRRATRS